jgi:hypothetical protein
MNVANKLQKIIVPVTKNSLIAALKKMPHLPVSSVIMLSIAELDILHDLGQWNIANLDQQMDVITHQYVCIKLAAKSGWQLFEEPKVAFSIIVVTEDHLPLITATHRMIQRSRKMDSGFSRHETSISPISSN